MRRWFEVGVSLAGLGWIVVLVALSGGAAVATGRIMVILVALGTAAVHLAGLVRAKWSGSDSDSPAWLGVQHERYRRLGAWFAAWGIGAAALAGVVAGAERGGTDWPGGLVWMVIGVNLGFQPGLFAAEFWGIMARSRLAAVESARKVPGSAELSVRPASPN